MLASFIGSQNFYSTAAQVIPVLALVQLVERRSERSRLPWSLDALALWLMITAAATGEMISFRVLYWGYGARTDQVYVITALAVAGVAVIVPALWTPTADLWRNRRQWHARGALGVVGVAILWLVFGFIGLIHR